MKQYAPCTSSLCGVWETFSNVISAWRFCPLFRTLENFAVPLLRRSVDSTPAARKCSTSEHFVRWHTGAAPVSDLRLTAARGLQMTPQRALGNTNSVPTLSKSVRCWQFLVLCDRGTFPGRKGARIANIRCVWTGWKQTSRFQVPAAAPFVAHE